jgi:hypothetical protein
MIFFYSLLLLLLDTLVWPLVCVFSCARARLWLSAPTPSPPYHPCFLPAEDAPGGRAAAAAARVRSCLRVAQARARSKDKTKNFPVLD